MTGYIGDTVTGPAEYSAGQTDLYTRLVDEANAASTDDDMLNDAELEHFLESLVGGDITAEQAQKLIKIYGNGDVVDTRTIVEVMTKDGFLAAVPGETFLTLTWGVNWDAIDGGLISDALFREVGLDPAVDHMTAAQFDEATDRLFGDTEGLNPENADFLTRNFGTGGSLSRDQLATVFEGDHLHIDGVAGEGYIRLFVNSTVDTLPFTDPAQATAYIMSFDANGDGVLDRTEFKAAIDSRLADGGQLSEEHLNDYMAFYGFTREDGARLLDPMRIDAMLAEGALYTAPLGTAGGQGFGVNLNITPIERVVAGGSLDDNMLNRDELAALFTKLGLGERTKEQMEFLLNVYGNGDVVDVPTIMGAMQEDGFLTLSPNLATPAALNWDEISGERIAAAVFREMGVDPAVPGATLTAEQFNDGVDRLFGDVEGQTIDDARQQVAIFGTDDKMTVAEMGAAFDDPIIHIDGVAGEGYVRIAAHSATAEDGSAVPGHHHDSWWDTALKYIEGGAKEAIAFMAKYGTLAEEELAKVLNGDITFEEAGEDLEKLLSKLAADVEAGIPEAIAFVEKLGEALKASFVNMTDSAKAFVDKLVEDAKATGEDALIFALVKLGGMTPEDAQKTIEMFGGKDKLANMAMNNTLEDWAKLLPGLDGFVSEGFSTYNELFSLLATNTETLQQLEDAGYQVTEEGVIHEGRMLSGEEGRNALLKILETLRVDIALEWNAGASDGALFDGLQFRGFICFKADDRGEIVAQLRVRVLEEAGGSVSPVPGSISFDGGLVTVHDYVIPLSGHDRDVKLISSLGIMGEGDLSGSGIMTALGKDVLNAAGVLPPPGGLEGGFRNFQNYDFETGLFVGFSVTHNLSERVRESGDQEEFFRPTTYEFFGYLGIEVLAAGFAAVAPEVALPLLAKTGITGLHALGMLGSFATDLVMWKTEPDGNVDLGFGVSWWGAMRANQGRSEGNILGTEKAFGSNVRERLQANLDLYSHDFG